MSLPVRPEVRFFPQENLIHIETQQDLNHWNPHENARIKSVLKVGGVPVMQATQSLAFEASFDQVAQHHAIERAEKKLAQDFGEALRRAFIATSEYGEIV